MGDELHTHGASGSQGFLPGLMVHLDTPLAGGSSGSFP